MTDGGQSGPPPTEESALNFDVRSRTAWRSFASAICMGLALSAAPASQAADAPLYGPVAAGAVQGGALTFGSLVEPPGLDPYHQAADARIRFTVLMYQGLFYEGADGRALPLLAESYQVSNNGLTYTFKLRPGVKFHTGATMTAKDVAYSYNYLRDSKNGSPGAGDLSPVTAVDAIDDSTVRMTLARVSAALPMALGNKYGGVVPAGYFDKPEAGQAMNGASVGTGPFKLAEFKPNSHLALVRNPDYWEKGAPYLDRINVLFVPNSSSLIVGLRNKRIDMASLNRPNDIVQVEKTAGLKVERWPSLAKTMIDLGSETKPLDDLRVRQAIALAVDREEIMKAAIGPYGRVIHTMVGAMQQQWGADPATLPNQKVDLAQARKLMAEAGFGKGLDLTLTTINKYDWMDPAAVTLKQQLARIGVNLTIQKQDLGVWINNFRGHRMGFTFNDDATQPDPDLMFYRHYHKQPEGADFRNWNDDTASAFLDQGRTELDLAKRKVAYVRFQNRLAESVPTIFLFSPDHVTVRSEAVRNFQQHPTGWYYGLVRTWLKK
jgi:ABC-type transport system substrate-binding protein